MLEKAYPTLIVIRSFSIFSPYLMNGFWCGLDQKILNSNAPMVFGILFSQELQKTHLEKYQNWKFSSPQNSPQKKKFFQIFFEKGAKIF